jgi:hypothetical protein
LRGGLFNRFCDLLFLAYVNDERQCLSAGFFDVFRRRVNRAFELGMRLVGFGRNRDIRTVARRAERNRKSDAARGTRDE